MDPKWASYGLMAELLDSLNIGVCLFDDDDRTQLWNRTFLRLFPEQDGALTAGEHYSANLYRFYGVRLGSQELPNIDQYVRDGVARHRAQSRPFVFEHRGKWLRVGSLPLPEGGRIRIWTVIPAPTADAGMARVLNGAEAVSDNAIMENVADGVMLLDADGRITQINEQCLLLYGFATRDQVIGRQYEEVLAEAWILQSPFPTPSGTSEHWIETLAEHRRFAGAPFEVELPRDFWLRVIEQRGPNGIAYSTHVDISELKRQQRAVNLAREEADRANAAKSAFLAMMSHEIRTPMNGIIGMNHLLLESGLQPRQQFYAETIGKSAGTLLGIIDDVLDVSKLEAGKLSLEAIPFDPDELVDETIGLMMPRARERGLVLDRLDGPRSGRRLGDPTRARQVLLNLISNAIKFTETGSVTVSVEVDTRQAGWITIKVVDTGIGLDAAALGKLFQRFEQADGTIARRFGGTGLGLHISKQLIELMGGRIGAEPRATGGSLFWFSLPLEPVLTTAAPAAARAAEPARQRGGRVLVVEDNLINQLVAEEILFQSGFTVEIASGGQAAIEQVALDPPDLILMDVQMPEMDGYEATRRILALSPDTATLPIIALTANAMEGDRQQCLAAGMVDYVAKPFDPPTLIQTVDRWIRRSPR